MCHYYYYLPFHEHFPYEWQCTKLYIHVLRVCQIVVNCCCALSPEGIPHREQTACDFLKYTACDPDVSLWDLHLGGQVLP